MGYTLTVTDTFSAAHALRGYRGKCESLHGHNWIVKASFSGNKLNSIGMVEDFTILKAALSKTLSQFDHTYLNETPSFKKVNPTAEHLAHTIWTLLYKKFAKAHFSVKNVEVWESDRSSAIYEP